MTYIMKVFLNYNKIFCKNFCTHNCTNNIFEMFNVLIYISKNITSTVPIQYLNCVMYTVLVVNA